MRREGRREKGKENEDYINKIEKRIEWKEKEREKRQDNRIYKF